MFTQSRDTNVQKPKKENFYHGILPGLLSHREDGWIRSSVESGEGYSDILIENEEREIGIVMEVKYAKGDDLDAGCETALAQIEEKDYVLLLREDGMKTIHKFGIACFRKHCKVELGKE